MNIEKLLNNSYFQIIYEKNKLDKLYNIIITFCNDNDIIISNYNINIAFLINKNINYLISIKILYLIYIL